MNKARHLSCSGLFLVALQALAQDAAPLQGAFTLVPHRSDDISAVVDAATASLNFISRPIARTIIKSRHQPAKRISITIDGQSAIVTFDSMNPMRMPLDGANTKWTRDDGEVLLVNAKESGAGLLQTIFTDDTKRVNEYSLGADGSTMTLDVTFTSEQLPNPMRYHLVYRREPAQ